VFSRRWVLVRLAEEVRIDWLRFVINLA